MKFLRYFWSMREKMYPAYIMIFALVTSILFPYYIIKVQAENGVANPNVIVSAGPGFQGAPNIQNEPSIAQSKANPANLVAGSNDYRFVSRGQTGCTYYRSEDGGAHWFSAGSIPGALPDAGDPVVRYGIGQDVFYACMVNNRDPVHPTHSILVSISRDDGRTWSEPTWIRQGRPDEFNDKPWMAIDTNPNSQYRNNVYLCWDQRDFSTNNPGTIQFAALAANADWSYTSSYGGSLATFPKNSISIPFCTIAVSPIDGKVYVAWVENPVGPISSRNPAHLMLKISNDGGHTWPSNPPYTQTVHDVIPVSDQTGQTGHVGQVPFATFPVLTYPVITAEPHSDRVHIAWTDARYGGNSNPDILMVTSNDQFHASWILSDVNRIGGDTSQTAQFDPAIDVDGSGTIHIVYYDKRYSKGLFDVTEAHSHDGGMSFTLNRVTDQPINLDDRNCNTYKDSQSMLQGPWIGEYIDTTSSWSNENHAVWTDCRNAADGVSKEDIYTSIIRTGP
jgi:hypothetical protein